MKGGLTSGNIARVNLRRHMSSGFLYRRPIWARTGESACAVSDNTMGTLVSRVFFSTGTLSDNLIHVPKNRADDVPVY